MSYQKKLIEDILSSYDTILGRKTFIKEAATFVTLSSTGYSNVKHDNDGTQNDSVNKALLDDIQTAAKSVGIVATITTAKTGHNQTVKGSTNISRHMNGTGVDVAILNGIGADGATNSTNGNPQFRELGNKLKDALVSMGYNLNAEGSSNPKAVLWQTNTGGNHFNHLHISNNSGVSASQPATTTQSTTDTTDTTSPEDETQTAETPSTSNFASKIGLSILNSMGIKESFKPGTFGVGAKIKGGKVLIPRNSNTKIKSPVSGKIVDVINNTSCINQIVIEFEDGFLEYCGITSPSKKIKDRVGVGTVLGATNSNVLVTLYKHNKNKTSIIFDNEPSSNGEKNKGEDVGVFTSLYRSLKKPSNEKPKEPQEPKNNDISPDDGIFLSTYKNLKKSFDRKPDKKLEENIERIKGLIK
jgi:hypothetical protein